MPQNEHVLQVLMWAWSIIWCGMFVLVILGVCEHATRIVGLMRHLLEELKLCVGLTAVVVQLTLNRLLHEFI